MYITGDTKSDAGSDDHESDMDSVFSVYMHDIPTHLKLENIDFE
eukprot:gene46644-58160_t